MVAWQTWRPVTKPLVDTVAQRAFADDQVATAVRFRAGPSASVAVAVNCADAPTSGAKPATVIEVTAAVGAEGLPHAETHTRQQPARTCGNRIRPSKNAT